LYIFFQTDLIFAG